jgi:hypothetical protein
MPTRKVIKLDCIQLQHDTPETPLLPPNIVHNSSDISFDGRPRSTGYANRTDARDKYNLLRKEKSSVRRLRKFVFGALYSEFYSGFHEVDALLNDYDIDVLLPTKKTSKIRIRLISPHAGIGNENLLSSLVEVGRTLSVSGNCRGKDVGDLGAMHAIGVKSASAGSYYVCTPSTSSKVETASRMMTEWMQDNMRDVLSVIRKKDEELQVEPTPSLKEAPGSRMMISVNLANSPHYDIGDSSESVAVWVEDKPGQSKNWYFVLPNMSHDGSKGVVIKLLHGLVISWDGREIFHCTSFTNTGGRDNRTYGCLWSSATK